MMIANRQTVFRPGVCTGHGSRRLWKHRFGHQVWGAAICPLGLHGVLGVLQPLGFCPLGFCPLGMDFLMLPSSYYAAWFLLDQDSFMMLINMLLSITIPLMAAAQLQPDAAIQP